MRTEIRKQLFVSGIALMVLALPAVSQESRTIVRTQIGTRTPMNGACAALVNAPGDMARTPEGMMLLRLKKDFEGVDSSTQMIVRYRRSDSVPGSTITMRRVDSTKSGNGKSFQNRIIIESDVEQMHPLRPSFEFSLRDLASQFSTMGLDSHPMRSAVSSGYMGISLSGSQMRLITDSGSFTTHCDLPMIEAVDVGSPARTAGLEVGDTVLAYNGRDIMAQAINYPQLLVPGNVVKVRVRREGKSREMPVTVGERPNDFSFEVTRAAPSAGGRSGGFMFVPRAGDAPEFTTRSWAWDMPSMNAIIGSATMATILGAQLNVVDDEFAQRLGLEPGILVLRVQPGSPSAEAGLKPGEMIRALNGVPVRELAPIRRAMSVSGARDVKFTVTGRDTPARIVTVRW